MLELTTVIHCAYNAMLSYCVLFVLSLLFCGWLGCLKVAALIGIKAKSNQL